MLDRDARVLITGCGGMLGGAIYSELGAACHVRATDLVCIDSWISPLDVRDLEAMRREAAGFCPTWIFHLAALTDMEYCETRPAEAYRTNALGTQNAATVCQERDIPIVYISTAGVFDGEHETYAEDDRPNPISVYGKSKYAGELAVETLLRRHFIFRAGWMMGGGPRKDKKFVNKVIQQLRGGATELHVVDDKLGSPTYTGDFARALVAVVTAGNTGLYHLVGQGECSRFEMAQEILRYFGLEERVAVVKVSSDYWSKEYFAPRPRSEQLLNRRLDLGGVAAMPGWKDSLHRYLASYDWQIL